MIQGNKLDVIRQMSEQLRDGKYYVVEISEMGNPRTRGQENRFYKVCRNISETTGYTVPEVKAILISGVFDPPKRVRDMTSSEMAMVIDRGQQVLAELGVYDER